MKRDSMSAAATNLSENMSLSDASRGISLWMASALCMLLVAEALHILLVGEWTFVTYGHVKTLYSGMLLIGTFFGFPACVFWIGGRPPPVPRWTLCLAMLVGCAVFGGHMLFPEEGNLRSPSAVISLVLAPLGVLAAGIVIASWILRCNKSLLAWARLYVRVVCLLAAMCEATRAGLLITMYVFPATWDYYVYRIDAAFGGVPAVLGRINQAGGPWLQTLTSVVYEILPVILYLFVALAMRQGAMRRLHAWRVFIMPFLFAWLLYAWLPVSGPQYAFFQDRFPSAMPLAASIPANAVIIPPAFRNGMPSMHLTGALLIWMLAVGLRQRIAVAFASLLVIATIWATLASGEHYFLDLAVAFPYAAVLGVSLIWPQRWRGGVKSALPIWLAAGSFAAWMIVLRAAPVWLSEQPTFVRLFSLFGVLVAVWVFVGIALAARECESAQLATSACVIQAVAPQATPFWVIGAFVASGIAGLMYEVIYSKALAVTFGSTALASYTVLATYMGGIALGAWLGGRAAEAGGQPLRAYALCEALIGIYAAATPKLFGVIQAIYVHFSLDAAPDSAWLTALRVLLGIACLGPPTLLMGATLPLMFKHLLSLGISSSRAVAPLYGANAIGAAIGSLVAGYAVLPAVGRDGGTFIASVLSLLVALYGLDRGKRTRAEMPKVVALEPAGGEMLLVQATDRVAGTTALAILFIGGGVTLGVEINSMHLLAVVAGSSVYAFALMLATFLAGLGLGSQAGQRLLARIARIELVAWAQCALALSIGLTALLWDDVPSYFASFGAYPVKLSFAGREAVRAMVCATAMLPPAFFIGLSYPAAMSLATDRLSPQGGARGLGTASGVNTLGNILGVVVTGFWLLPSYGSRTASLTFALVALGLGLLALTVGSRTGQTIQQPGLTAALRWAPALAAVATLAFFPEHWNYDDLSTGGNVYFAPQAWGQVVDHAESIEGGLTTVAKSNKGVSTLLTNGKFQGNDAAGGEMIAQESFALFPLLHTRLRDSALVIGYGTGMTTRVLHESGFKQVEVAELSKDIVMLANRHFGEINHHVTESPGVHVRYTDGRNYLLTQSRKFDLMSIEISSIWFAGAANLYNRDFYALAKTRLQSSGVLQQWVQLHHISPIDLVYVIGSIRSEFKYVWLYVRGGQGILVASNANKSLGLPGEEQLKDASRDAGDARQPAQLRTHLLLSPAGVDRLVSKFDPTKKLLVSTDQNLFLEYSTPKGNALGDVVASNLRLLAGFEPHDD